MERIIDALSQSEWIVLLVGAGLIGYALKFDDKKTRLLVIRIGMGLVIYSLLIKTIVFAMSLL